MFKDEKIYIAGPECFYTGGYEMLGAMLVHAVNQLHPHFGGFLIRKPSGHMKPVFSIAGM